MLGTPTYQKLTMLEKQADIGPVNILNETIGQSSKRLH